MKERQQQSTSTKRAEDEDAAVQEDVVTHAQRCAPGRERDQVPHSRSSRGVHSLIFHARVNRTLRRLNRHSSRTRLRPVAVKRRAPMAQAVLGSPAVAVHRRGRRDPRPDAAADLSSSDRASNDPLMTQRQLPTIQKIPKTVEIPQAQFMETNP